jgi:phosphoribosylaminoimidazole-succinocarboxamide synthase
LPPGLQESSRLPAPIFTPATKAEEGHDENISYERAAEIVGNDLARKVLRHTLTIYEGAAEYALSRGIIIADTKMEFGIRDGMLILIDELLTPDSSRFWPAAQYAPGRPQESFDKQYVRDYLVSIKFNRQPPGPVMPQEVIHRTSELYREALKQLTGSDVD